MLAKRMNSNVDSFMFLLLDVLAEEIHNDDHTYVDLPFILCCISMASVGLASS